MNHTDLHSFVDIGILDTFEIERLANPGWPDLVSRSSPEDPSDDDRLDFSSTFVGRVKSDEEVVQGGFFSLASLRLVQCFRLPKLQEPSAWMARLLLTLWATCHETVSLRSSIGVLDTINRDQDGIDTTCTWRQQLRGLYHQQFSAAR